MYHFWLRLFWLSQKLSLILCKISVMAEAILAKLGLFPAPRRGTPDPSEDWSGFFCVDSIVCHLSIPTKNQTPAQALVLYCHGNGEDVLDSKDFLPQLATKSNCYFLSFDFP